MTIQDLLKDLSPKLDPDQKRALLGKIGVSTVQDIYKLPQDEQEQIRLILVAERAKRLTAANVCFSLDDDRLYQKGKKEAPIPKGTSFAEKSSLG